MRKLITTDIPAACRCLKRIGIKDKIKAISKQANSIDEVWDNGFNLLWDIFDAATEAAGENELYRFLSGPFEMSPEEVANLELTALLDNLKQLAEENDLAGFFDFVRQAMK